MLKLADIIFIGKSHTDDEIRVLIELLQAWINYSPKDLKERDQTKYVYTEKEMKQFVKILTKFGFKIIKTGIEGGDFYVKYTWG